MSQAKDRIPCFVELPGFHRYREEYLDDDAYFEFQKALIKNPEAGDLIPGTGGLRKLRHEDKRRGKGKRGGLRIIYYFWIKGSEFWLFTVYDKDEAVDLTAGQRKQLKKCIDSELRAKSKE
jgi:mRNA-degrading endonuclease RelE of RelBE toxin-antitoxin system